MDYLENQAAASPERSAQYSELNELYQKKLWHQMAVKLREIEKDESFQKDKALATLFENFVSKCKINLNPLSFVQFAISASQQHDDTTAGLKFLESLELKADAQPEMLLKMAQARLQVQLKAYKEAKKLLDEGRTTIDAYMGVMEPCIHSSFYLASLEYYQALGPAASFFSNSLLYLTYTPLESIPKDKQVRLAADVTLAALVGHHIYNFGELLQHPVVKVLKSTEHEWLAHLLTAFNAGDIAGFQKVFKAQKTSQAVLSENEAFLNQKIRIMALIEMIFHRNSNSRELSFDEIAAACELKVDEVELLLMKACSLGVIKGEIDQVDLKVRVKWVQPRVLSTTQLSSVKERLVDWAGKVKNTAHYLEENAPELLQGFA